MATDSSPSETGQLFKRIAFVYNERLGGALPLAEQLAATVRGAGREVGLVSAWDDNLARQLDAVELAVTFGGDGTILRVGRQSGPLGIPILGVNLGRLGFLTEIKPQDCEKRLIPYLEGHCWIESRAMLDITLTGPASPPRTYCALNDVTMGRAERTRVVSLEITVDGGELATIRADGVVVATPTGSTAYSLSAGGPIVHPGVRGLVLTPILAHLSFLKSIVVPSEASIAIHVHTDHSATCSIDGQIDVPVADGARMSVGVASFPCRFLRAHKGNYFYEKLLERLRPCDG